MQIWDANYKDTDVLGNRRLVWKQLNYRLWERLSGYANPKSIILEAGCGISDLMNTFVSKGTKVVGLDISSIALSKAHKFFKKPFLVQGDLYHLPFRNDSFDLVYSVGVVEHFNDPRIVLQEMCRVLKKSGDLAVAVPNKFTLWTIGRIFKGILNRFHLSEAWRFGYEHSYSKGELEHLFRRLRFEKLEVFGCGTLEAVYITTYFALFRPKLLIQLLHPLLSNNPRSIWGRILCLFAEIVEKMDILGMLVIAHSQHKHLRHQ